MFPENEIDVARADRIVQGVEREAALRAFRDKLGNNVVWDYEGHRFILRLAEYTFWHNPPTDDAPHIIITDRNQITWN